MFNIQINGRFKIYDDLVVINKEVWQLPTFNRGSKRTKQMRKLKYYQKRKAYGYNRSYISKHKLLKLFYKSNETINKLKSRNYETITNNTTTIHDTNPSSKKSFICNNARP